MIPTSVAVFQGQRATYSSSSKAKPYHHQIAAVCCLFLLLDPTSHTVRAFSMSGTAKLRHSSTSNTKTTMNNQNTKDTLQSAVTHPWCCTAHLDPITKRPQFQTVTSTNNADTDGLDLTTSPDWMEWIEVTEGRSGDEGGAGAYDTLRCDLVVKNKDPEGCVLKSVIWGEDYHLDRLQNSFQSLPRDNDNLPETAITMATQESKVLLQALLQQAQSSQQLLATNTNTNSKIPNEESTNDEAQTWIQLIKLTLLWSLPKTDTTGSNNNSNNMNIVVRGHACSSTRPIPIFRSVPPIVVTLAALGQHSNHNNDLTTMKDDKDKNVNVDASLPTRFQNPQSKVASWCKQRKKMDNPETYKPPGVSEVLMLRPTTTTTTTKSQDDFSSLQLLEGLSSNVFVIYKDGTLRTAEEGVLFGYVRHLVLQASEKCGLKVDTTQPIVLQDALEGKWSEVFITSSSRLIWPISRILLPTENAHCLQQQLPSSDALGSSSSHEHEECDIEGFTEFWKDPVLTGPGVQFSTPQWQALLEEILHTAGYQR